jgi:hypothetical protein
MHPAPFGFDLVGLDHDSITDVRNLADVAHTSRIEGQTTRARHPTSFASNRASRAADFSALSEFRMSFSSMINGER